jgi:cellobiose-specific phosphotransferase system component IIA
MMLLEVLISVVPVGDNHDSRVDILVRVTAALNTHLEGATTESDRTHEELQNAHNWRLILQGSSHQRKQHHPILLSHLHARDSNTTLQKQPLVLVMIGV